MPLVPAKCTNCGGDIQLDESKEKGFCLHCGSQVIVQDAIKKMQVQVEGVVQVEGIAKAEGLLKIAKDTYDDGNHEAAYDLFTKVLTLDPTNEIAQLYRGLSAGWMSTLKSPRYSESINAAKRAIESAYASKGPTDEFYAFTNLVLVENNKIINAVFSIASKHYKEFSTVEGTLSEYSEHMDGLVQNEKYLFATALNTISPEATEQYLKNLVGLLNHLYQMCVELLTSGVWKSEYSYGLMLEILGLLNMIEIPASKTEVNKAAADLVKNAVNQFNQTGITKFSVFSKTVSRDAAIDQYIQPLLQKMGLSLTVKTENDLANVLRIEQERKRNEEQRKSEEEKKRLKKIALIWFSVPIIIMILLAAPDASMDGAINYYFQVFFGGPGLIFIVPCWSIAGYLMYKSSMIE